MDKTFSAGKSTLVPRDINNYPDAVIAPFLDPLTKAYFPQAVYTTGSFTVSSRDKTLTYEIDVFASVEAFEAGGASIDTPIRRVITSPPTPFYPENGGDVVLIDYDSTIIANAMVVGGVLQILAGLEAQFSPVEAVHPGLMEEK